MSGDLDAWAKGVERRARERAGKVLLALATDFQAEAKKDYSVPNPAPHLTPAPRGSWPRGRTWNLRDHIVIDPPSLAAITAAGEVRVGVQKNAFYGAELAKRGWKGLLDSYRKARPRLLRLRKFLGG